MNHEFAWASKDGFPPARWDLRHLGWHMHWTGQGDCVPEGVPCLFDCRPASRTERWPELASKSLVAAIGADDAKQRADMLACGLGEALSSRVALVELSARLTRLADAYGAMPRYIQAGPVKLDLLLRDGLHDDRRLGLHPREFGVLWRLAEAAGDRVGRRELLTDVWRIDYEPETNSLEVHVSRLRAKLAVIKLAWLVQTDPAGGYRLHSESTASFSAFSRFRQQSLDSHRCLGNGDRQSLLIESPSHAME